MTDHALKAAREIAKKCFPELPDSSGYRFDEEKAAAVISQAIQEATGPYRELLKVSKCPNCDGSGVVIYTQDDDGRYMDIGPCQWCDERAALLPKETK